MTKKININLQNVPVTQELIDCFSEFISWEDINVDHVEVISTDVLKEHCELSIKTHLMLEALQQGNYKATVKLLDAGVPIESDYLLQYALQSRKSNIILHLIKRGVNLTKRNSRNAASLAVDQTVTIMKALVKNGFPTKRLYHHAIDRKRWDIVKLLLSLDVDLNQDDEKCPLAHMANINPTCHLLCEDYFETLSLVLERDPTKIHERTLDYNMHTPFMVAVYANNLRAAQILLDAGSDFYARNKDRNGILRITNRGDGDEKMVDFLKKHHAKLQKSSKVKFELE